MSFLNFPMFGQQQMEQQPTFYANEMRLYSDSEIEILIEEITVAALEAIEKAASEAARAAILASLERETAAIRDAQRWRLEAELQQNAVTQAKQAGRKNLLLGVLISLLGGITVGVTGTLVIGSR
jgi:ABC-type transporter Mla maintaining outer membrane lipid asymmetry permease subunit MlaE